MEGSALGILTRVSIVCLLISSIQSTCDVDLSVELPTATIFENGSAWDGTHLYPNGTYWTGYSDGSVNATNVTRGCPCSLEKPCLRKCCPYFQQMVDLECAEDGVYDDLWFKPIVSENGNSTWELEDAGHFRIIESPPCIGYSVHPAVESGEEFYIRLSDGKLCLLTGDEANATCLEPRKFCLDYVPGSDVYNAFACMSEEEDPVDVRKEEVMVINFSEPFFEYVLVASISVSTIFLAVTFLVYVFIPELRSLPGKCHMCHVLSVFVYDAIHLVYTLAKGFLSQHPWITCYTIDIPNYFFYFTSFSWLNVICYDICMAFIELRPISSPLRQQEFKRFICYSLYAWSAPLLVFAACVLLELFTLSEENPMLRLGNLCAEPAISHSWLYNIAPMSFLMICNVILFIVTAINLFRAKRATAVLEEGENRRNQDENRRRRFKMYLKLLIVMGLNWSVEPVYWTIHKWVSDDFSILLWRILLVMVVISYLQGFFIFMIFVWNDRVIGLIKKRLIRIKRSKRMMEYLSALNCVGSNSSSNHSSQDAVMRY